MSLQISPIPAHPQGEGFSALVASSVDSLLPAMAVDTVGRRFHVEWVLASLSGAWRYAHVTALRGDQVNPQGLGM